MDAVGVAGMASCGVAVGLGLDKLGVAVAPLGRGGPPCAGAAGCGVGVTLGVAVGVLLGRAVHG